VTVDEVLSRASARIARWRVVASTIPSTAVHVTVARRLPPGAESVTLTATEFELVVALRGGCTIAELAQRLGTGGFEVCERVHDLMLRGVLEVSSAPAADPVGWG
jgi:voltage-gated potassium channel Kch